MNRETWLNALATKMAPRFEELGHPVPPFRVAIGFTSGGRGSNANGECWHASKSADKRFEILITPDNGNELQVAAILAHELSHAAAGFKEGHKGKFAQLMKALGMQRPFTTSTPGPQFAEWVKPHLDELGALPHAPLMFRQSLLERIAKEAGGAGVDEADEGGSSNQKKKQTTRMLKAACQAEGKDGKPCGYTIRLTKKWALQLGACCPVHGAMEVEGADKSGGEDDADQ